MRKDRVILSPSELLDYSKGGSHLCYEINMLAQTAYLLARRDTALQFRNSLTESFAIHLRNLIDFLYPGDPFKTDVLAEDFFVDGQPLPQEFPPLSQALEEARTQANKQISHLTSDRVPEGDPRKLWRYLELSQEVLSVLSFFAEHASPAKLHCQTRKEIEVGSILLNNLSLVASAT